MRVEVPHSTVWWWSLVVAAANVGGQQPACQTQSSASVKAPPYYHRYLHSQQLQKQCCWIDCLSKLHRPTTFIGSYVQCPGTHSSNMCAWACSMHVPKCGASEREKWWTKSNLSWSWVSVQSTAKLSILVICQVRNVINFSRRNQSMIIIVMHWTFMLAMFSKHLKNFDLRLWKNG